MKRAYPLLIGLWFFGIAFPASAAIPDGALYVTTSNRDGRGTVHVGDDRIVKVYPDFLRVSR